MSGREISETSDMLGDKILANKALHGRSSKHLSKLLSLTTVNLVAIFSDIFSKERVAFSEKTHAPF
ncbi:MAG: hypothetical protein DI617_08110 [Streptococcus pyogenes]|nr:MAG: hypothetical protein DI617_08110 [Streptococcus pyogenes]